jgi:hypothetical protein
MRTQIEQSAHQKLLFYHCRARRGNKSTIGVRLAILRFSISSQHLGRIPWEVLRISAAEPQPNALMLRHGFAA